MRKHKVVYSYHPFSPKMEWVLAHGHSVLSCASCLLIFAAMIATVFFKSEVLNSVLWAAFAGWVLLFFSYLLFRFIFERKRAKLFKESGVEKAVNNMRGLSNIIN